MDREEEILATIADLYYVQDYSQKEIAEKLFYSRAKVSRLLKKAKLKKVVKINITYPFIRNSILENHLSRKYGVKFVIPSASVEKTDSLVNLMSFYRFSADYIFRNFFNFSKIGFSSGKTLMNVVKNINDVKMDKITLVQLKGMLPVDHDYKYDSVKIIQELAAKLECATSYIYAPLFIENVIVRDYLKNEPLLKKAIENAINCDVIFCSVGNLDSGNNIWNGFISQSQKNKFISSKAVGSMLSHFYDIHGNIVDRELDNKMIGVDFEQLKQKKNVCVIVYEVNKAQALIGAIHTNIINYVICSEELALLLK